MHISLDFDGVIADCGALKCAAAQELYGKRVFAPKVASSAVLAGKSVLTMEEYQGVQKAIYTTTEWHDRLEPVDGSVSSIKALFGRGFDVCIVTARFGESLELARAWLRMHDIDIPSSGVGYKESKDPYLEGTDLFIDDDPEHVRSALSKSIQSYVFAWPYNYLDIQEAQLPHVTSWEHILREIDSLSA